MFDQLFTFSFAVMLIVVYFSGIIRGYTGFGSALLTVPALAILFGPVQAVAIEILIEIPVSIGLLPKAIKLKFISVFPLELVEVKGVLQE